MSLAVTAYTYAVPPATEASVKADALNRDALTRVNGPAALVARNTS
jgi:hypothetical protein